MRKQRWKRIIASGVAAVMMTMSLTGCRFGFASDPDDENETEVVEPIDMTSVIGRG